jgi:hypothetical protein
VQPPEQDIVNRRPVWEALSNLYLDTELSVDDLALIRHAAGGVALHRG